MQEGVLLTPNGERWKRLGKAFYTRWKVGSKSLPYSETEYTSDRLREVEENGKDFLFWNGLRREDSFNDKYDLQKLLAIYREGKCG